MVVTRRNILSDQNYRNKYIEGVKRLKNDFLRNDWFNTYDIFIIWHYYAMMTLTPANNSSLRNAAHSGPSFLPWHRYMLILFEYHLQRVLQDPDFGLPYWDWSLDGNLPPNLQKTVPIWQDSCMGGTGNPVSSGPFQAGSWSVNIEMNSNSQLVSTNRPLRRSLGLDTSSLPSKQDVLNAIKRNEPNVFYDSPPWNLASIGFRNELEGWADIPGPSLPPILHNKVHVWVGLDMATATSPNDPIFYLNHCYVDCIWQAWLQKHGNPQYHPDSSESELLQFHRLDDNLYVITENEEFDPIFNGSVTPSDLLDISDKYNYEGMGDLL